jgi:hypothetical protein
VLQLVDGDVRRQVVDPIERLAQRQRVRLCRGHADQQRTGQAGPGGHGHRVDVVDRCTGIGQRPVHRRDHRLQMRTGGDLGDDAAEALVLRHRRRQGVGEQGVPADQPDTGLVARRLEPEHERLAHGFSRFITAEAFHHEPRRAACVPCVA